VTGNADGALNVGIVEESARFKTLSSGGTKMKIWLWQERCRRSSAFIEFHKKWMKQWAIYIKKPSKA
jgi:hypothetical protein